VLLEWRELLHHPLATLMKPGYMLHGGILGGAVAITVFGVRSQAPLLALTDAFALALPMGEAIARLGCHVYGCCYGKPTGSRFGITYTSPHAKVIRIAPHLRGVKIYPAQLFGFVSHMALFAVLVALIPLATRHGLLAGVYFLIHPMLRLVLERFRHDDRGLVTASITHTSLYSVIQFAGGIFLLGLVGDMGAVVSSMPAGGAVSWLSPAVAVLLGFHFVIAAAAFGVHIDSVGSWVPRRAGSPRLVHGQLKLAKAVSAPSLSGDHFASTRSK
jgi:hypothetical protein